MKTLSHVHAAVLAFTAQLGLNGGLDAANPPAFPADPSQAQERTSFQTGQSWSPLGNLPADVAMVYGIDARLPERVQSWRDRGYRVHLMTGVSWGQYQDYLYGRFDGKDHTDNAQTDRNGKKISHGGDVYYMCPAENFGEFLSVGVQRALEAGVDAVHLEEPEFWARAGYSEGFKREWQSYYHEAWQDPQASVDGQWRASKLKYFLYRRALQQVFRHVQDFNRRTGRAVRCYVPTHSLLNYAHWCIVSPQSSLAQLEGCDGYIAQVWTGTSRTPNHYRGERRERTFETAFLEYGAMQNLVRATGRRVWYLNDPVEDNPRHDWTDYRVNWESTLTASLLQPDVWRYEVAPWPERVFGGRYPHGARREDQQPIPPAYATELQVVMQAMNDLHRTNVQWDCGTRGVGVLVSDSLMFQRERPTPSDPNMAHVYGLCLPLLKRGLPVTPVQLENAPRPGFLDDQRVLLLTYEGQKPQSADVHPPLADWVRKGGVLVVVDDDRDPYQRVREWWNEEGKTKRLPRQHLFAALGIEDGQFTTNFLAPSTVTVGQGAVTWVRQSPVPFALSAEAARRLVGVIRQAAGRAGLQWRESRSLSLRRGPYVVGVGLDETEAGDAQVLRGRFVNLFDPELAVQREVELSAGKRVFLLDLDRSQAGGRRLLASGCKAVASSRTGPGDSSRNPARVSWTVEGVGGTSAIVLLSAAGAPRSVELDGNALSNYAHDAGDGLVRIRFPNEARPRELVVTF